MKDLPSTATSVAFLLLPTWLDWLPAAWQALLMLLGGIVLGLTAYNKYLDAMIKRKDLLAPKSEENQ